MKETERKTLLQKGWSIRIGLPKTREHQIVHCIQSLSTRDVTESVTASGSAVAGLVDPRTKPDPCEYFTKKIRCGTIDNFHTRAVAGPIAMSNNVRVCCSLRRSWYSQLSEMTCNWKFQSLWFFVLKSDLIQVHSSSYTVLKFRIRVLVKAIFSLETESGPNPVMRICLVPCQHQWLKSCLAGKLILWPTIDPFTDSRGAEAIIPMHACINSWIVKRRINAGRKSISHLVVVFKEIYRQLSICSLVSEFKATDQWWRIQIVITLLAQLIPMHSFRWKWLT